MKTTRRKFLKKIIIGSTLITKSKITVDSFSNILFDENPLGIDKKYQYSEKDLKKFHTWINQTTEKSRTKKDYAIIIDKAAYTLSTIKQGSLYSQYNIELGFDPYLDKQYEGDGRTPEGLYKIVTKKDGKKGETVFHKALLINYPNAQDWKEFKELKNKGLVPLGRGIGESIEIHGHGSGNPGNKKGKNWTLGCIALSNKDMDQIFPLIQEGIKNGTNTTIVRYGANLLIK